MNKLRAQGNGMDYVCQQLITQPFNITDSSTEAVVDCETYQGLVMKSDTSEATSALSSSSSWNLEQALNDEKNPFSNLTEEHLNKLDDVLSSKEVNELLQQTNLSELESSLAPANAGVFSAESSLSDNLGQGQSDVGHLDQPLKLDLFGSPMSDSNLHLDNSLVDHIIKDEDLTAMSDALFDHAYALPTVVPSSPSEMFCPRKSSRVRKNAFHLDSDFDYYFVPPARKSFKKDQANLNVSEKLSSSSAFSSPELSKSSKRPSRRSIRIVDMETREKAEKILQENRQIELEAKAALSQQKKEPEAKAALSQQKKEPEAKAALSQQKKEPEAKAALSQQKNEPEAKAILSQQKKEPEAKAALSQQKKEPEAKAALSQQKKEPEAKAALSQQKTEPEAKAALSQQRKDPDDGGGDNEGHFSDGGCRRAVGTKKKPTGRKRRCDGIQEDNLKSARVKAKGDHSVRTGRSSMEWASDCDADDDDDDGVGENGNAVGKAKALAVDAKDAQTVSGSRVKSRKRNKPSLDPSNVALIKEPSDDSSDDDIPLRAIVKTSKLLNKGRSILEKREGGPVVKAGIGPVAKGDVDGEEGNGTKVPSPCDNENGENHDNSHLSYEDDANDADWEPTVERDAVYCLCRKPHDNRFMICCDKCGEWYHGDCIGVTMEEGQVFEKTNTDYICPVCTGNVQSAPTAPQPDEKGDWSETKCSELLAEVSNMNTDASLNGSMEKHQPTGKASSHEEGGARGKTEKWTAAGIKHQKVAKRKWPRDLRCVCSGCKKSARLGSVFCSTMCIIRHARGALSAIRSTREAKEQDGSMKLDGESKSGVHHAKVVEPRSCVHRVKVVEPRSGKVLTGPVAPTEEKLELWLQTHPSFHAVLPTTTDPSPCRQAHGGGKQKQVDCPSPHLGDGHDKVRYSVRKRRRETAVPSAQTFPDVADKVRLNVRRSLRDALVNRAREAKNISLSGVDIKRLALNIEEELFKVYTDTGHKYRAKYRSLVFNIRDPKNMVLYRKIMCHKIKASHLVRMSSEELASKQLAMWRKMETKHTLDSIVQVEQEAMEKGQPHVRKKTHKGEIDVADEDMSTLVAQVNETGRKTEQKEAECPSVLLLDTTDHHRSHLFDLNCRICTGKTFPSSGQQVLASRMLPADCAHGDVPEAESEGIRRKTSFEGGRKKKSVTVLDVMGVNQVGLVPDEEIMGDPQLLPPGDPPCITLDGPGDGGGQIYDGHPVAEQETGTASTQDDPPTVVAALSTVEHSLSSNQSDPAASPSEPHSECSSSTAVDGGVSPSRDCSVYGGVMGCANTRYSAAGVGRLSCPTETDSSSRLRNAGGNAASRSNALSEDVTAASIAQHQVHPVLSGEPDGDDGEHLDEVHSDDEGSSVVVSGRNRISVEKSCGGSIADPRVRTEPLEKRYGSGDVLSPASIDQRASPIKVRGSPGSTAVSTRHGPRQLPLSGGLWWKGCLVMQDFTKIFTSAYYVSGSERYLGLSGKLQICGRINPKQMWDYVSKVHQAGSREVTVLRFVPGNGEEKAAYVDFYSYLTSRGRCGVVGSSAKHIRDFYIVPLASHSRIPQLLLQFEGPGLESSRPHMLLGIIVRQKLKRASMDREAETPAKNSVSAKGSSADGAKTSNARKLGVWKAEGETEAYSPSAGVGCGEDGVTGMEPLYIPTPNIPASSATPNLSTPSSSRSSSVGKIDADCTGSELYSPSNIVYVRQDVSAPYDPADVNGCVRGIDDHCVSVKSGPKEKPADSLEMLTHDHSLPVDVDIVMRKISLCSDPDKISSLMVSALARAKTSEEQKSILTALTQRVEEARKRKSGACLLGRAAVCAGSPKDLPSELLAGTSQSTQHPASVGRVTMQPILDPVCAASTSATLSAVLPAAIAALLTGSAATPVARASQGTHAASLGHPARDDSAVIFRNVKTLTTAVGKSPSLASPAASVYTSAVPESDYTGRRPPTPYARISGSASIPVPAATLPPSHPPLSIPVSAIAPVSAQKTASTSVGFFVRSLTSRVGPLPANFVGPGAGGVIGADVAAVGTRDVSSVDDMRQPADIISAVSAASQSKDSMPLALKALLDELKGSSPMSCAVEKRTVREDRQISAAKSDAFNGGLVGSSDTGLDFGTQRCVDHCVIPGLSEVGKVSSNDAELPDWIGDDGVKVQVNVSGCETLYGTHSESQTGVLTIGSDNSSSAHGGPDDEQPDRLGDVDLRLMAQSQVPTQDREGKLEDKDERFQTPAAAAIVSGHSLFKPDDNSFPHLEDVDHRRSAMVPTAAPFFRSQDNRLLNFPQTPQISSNPSPANQVPPEAEPEDVDMRVTAKRPAHQNVTDVTPMTNKLIRPVSPPPQSLRSLPKLPIQGVPRPSVGRQHWDEDSSQRILPRFPHPREVQDFDRRRHHHHSAHSPNHRHPSPPPPSPQRRQDRDDRHHSYPRHGYKPR